MAERQHGNNVATDLLQQWNVHTGVDAQVFFRWIVPIIQMRASIPPNGTVWKDLEMDQRTFVKCALPIIRQHVDGRILATKIPALFPGLKKMEKT